MVIKCNIEGIQLLLLLDPWSHYFGYWRGLGSTWLWIQRTFSSCKLEPHPSPGILSPGSYSTLLFSWLLLGDGLYDEWWIACCTSLAVKWVLWPEWCCVVADSSPGVWNFIEDSVLILGFPKSSVSKESDCNARDTGLIPRLGRSPGGGHGNPLQYSSLWNPMGRGAWWATVHGVAKSQTWLSN